MAKKRGRPPLSVEEAHEFGRLVELERKPGEKLETVFLRVRRRDKRRWGSRSKMWRLWDLHKQTPPMTPLQQLDHILRQAENHMAKMREAHRLLDSFGPPHGDERLLLKQLKSFYRVFVPNKRESKVL